MSTTYFPLWKSALSIVAMFATLKILGHWISESLAWAAGGFVMVVLTHLLPPKTTLAVWNAIVLAGIVAFLLYLITRLVG
jgi:hypothetical protein